MGKTIIGVIEKLIQVLGECQVTRGSIWSRHGPWEVPSGGELRKSGSLPGEGEKRGHSKEKEQCVEDVREDGPAWDCGFIKYDQSLETRVEVGGSSGEK